MVARKSDHDRQSTGRAASPIVSSAAATSGSARRRGGLRRPREEHERLADPPQHELRVARVLDCARPGAEVREQVPAHLLGLAAARQLVDQDVAATGIVGEDRLDGRRGTLTSAGLSPGRYGSAGRATGCSRRPAPARPAHGSAAAACPVTPIVGWGCAARDVDAEQRQGEQHASAAARRSPISAKISGGPPERRASRRRPTEPSDGRHPGGHAIGARRAGGRGGGGRDCPPSGPTLVTSRQPPSRPSRLASSAATLEQATEERRVRLGEVRGRRDVSDRDHEDVGRRLRVDVADREHEVVLVDLVDGDRAGDAIRQNRQSSGMRGSSRGDGRRGLDAEVARGGVDREAARPIDAVGQRRGRWRCGGR